MESAITLIGLLFALAIAGLLVHLSLTWMSKRGWIWYRTKDRPRPSSLGLIEEIYQPSVEHVMEEQAGEQARADQAESGDGEEPGPR
jgi:hypothetical protein